MYTRVDSPVIPWAPIGKCAHINLNMLSIPCRLFPDTHGCRSLSPSGFPTGRGITMETDMMSAQWHCWLLKDEVPQCVYMQCFLDLEWLVCVLSRNMFNKIDQLVVQTLVWWNDLGMIPTLRKGDQPNNHSSLCLRIYLCISKCACVCMGKCHETPHFCKTPWFWIKGRER